MFASVWLMERNEVSLQSITGLEAAKFIPLGPIRENMWME